MKDYGIAIGRVLLLATLLALLPTISALAHRSECHLWHSCPSDQGTYVCGDLGHCSWCPDNTYCLNRKPRPTQEGQAPHELPRRELQKFGLSVQVIRVIDGDIIEVCCVFGDRVIVHYIGINTPETQHPTKGVEYYGKQASDANRRLVDIKTVRLEFDVEQRDRHGRLLSYVYLEDGTFVNAWLVKWGYAQVMTVLPNVKHQDLFLKLQREAREASRGVWGR